MMRPLSSSGDLALHPAGLPPRLPHNLDSCQVSFPPPSRLPSQLSPQVFPQRVVDAAPLRGHRLRRPERLHPRQQFLVRRGNSDAAGLRPQPQGRLHQDRGRHLVVLHPHHHLLLHRQPGRLPHRGEDGHSDREGGRSGRAVGHPVRDTAGGINHDLLQRLSDRNLPENVEVTPDFPSSISHSLLSSLLRYMESKEPAVFVSTYKEGVERVLEGETVLASTHFVKTDLVKLWFDSQ